MKVIVTGATSFIGAATVRKLLAAGHEVVGVVRPGSSNLGHLKRMLPEHAERDGRFVSEERNLHEIEGLGCKKADAWIHIGWDGAGSENRTKRDVQQGNVVQSLKAVRAAYERGCTRFIFTGSQAEYGVCHDWITEETPLHPVSEYGKAKVDFCRQATELCEEFNRERTEIPPLQYIHTRIFSVYGPGDHPWSLVNSCVNTWKDGGHMQFGACTQQWNFLYIEDAADALVHFLTEGQAGCYNLAGEDTRPLKEYIDELYRLCGSRGTFVFGERPENAEGPADLMPDISKVLSETAWRPKTVFADGIRSMLGADT